MGCYFLLQGSSWPRDQTHVSCISYVGRWILYQLITWEVLQIYVYESPLDSKEVKPINPKVNQPWIFIGKTGAEAPILWPPDAKNWLTEKGPDTGKDWRQEEKEATEYKMVGWHHRLSGHEFEQTSRDSEGQGSLVCCSPWGHRVRHDLASEQQQQQGMLWIFYSINTLWYLSQEDNV